MTDWIGDAVRVSAPAKLNLSLSIVGHRADGYHLLDSIVVPIALFDEIVIRIAPGAAPAVSLRCDPPDAAPPGQRNLAVQAAELLLRRRGIAAHVAIALVKRIPAGTGLGGGSSDAAAVLRGLNSLLDQPVPRGHLTAWALELGADVPLFLCGGPARIQGIGERVEPCSVEVTQPLVVAFTGRALDTRAVYAKYDDLLTMSGALSSIRPVTSGREPLHSLVHNDLEAAAFHLQPAVRSLKKRLSALGAAGASMTGSGSAVFGWWQSWEDACAAAQQLRAAGVWARVARVLERIPAVEPVIG
jgi:4-diphosphocytidyl-2-C-methyl-D-erythritol kinase